MIDEKKLIEDLKESGMIVDNEYGNAMVDLINSQPKVGEWIPCSERLPKIESEVIITSEDGFVWGDFYYGCEEETDNKPCFYKWDDEFWHCYTPKVIAWMPMPKPYEGEEND